MIAIELASLLLPRRPFSNLRSNSTGGPQIDWESTEAMECGAKRGIAAGSGEFRQVSGLANLLREKRSSNTASLQQASRSPLRIASHPLHRTSTMDPTSHPTDALSAVHTTPTVSLRARFLCTGCTSLRMPAPDLQHEGTVFLPRNDTFFAGGVCLRPRETLRVGCLLRKMYAGRKVRQLLSLQEHWTNQPYLFEQDVC